MIVSGVVHSALVVIRELAVRYNRSKISAKQLSQNNNISQDVVDEIVISLANVGFIRIKDEQGVDTVYSSEAYIYLAKNPNEIYVADLINYFNNDL